ncbi:uncharacterized protein C5orf49 homolog [Aplysia californica]|uniref:Uncharacterized protein C5orf49 homolog n=1 Tax=Aplysia californica TaxID=6500 RepID=A0ABM1A608_APLCA|nr:uncharacterized protein C5orf49 homolog [Aplysia californica]
MTPEESSNFWKENIKKSEDSHKRHLTTKMCKQSRFPFTDQLSAQQMVCMRDTYAGHRRFTSAVLKKRLYDRLSQWETGWNQRSHRGDRQENRNLQLSSRDEEKFRVVPVLANSIYGHRPYSLDYLSGQHSRYSQLKREVYSRNNIKCLSLPPDRPAQPQPSGLW